MRKTTACVLATLFPALALAAPSPNPQAETQALELAKEAIALRSVQGPGNQTPAVAALFRKALIANGFDESDITITPVDDTAYLIARWPGSDPSLKPLVISGHMDVVEARAADWERDPFKPVVENGYLFGRGATDMKFDDALAITALGELRRQGFRPRRTIVVEFSGDEETTMKTGQIIAEKLNDADLVLNVDGGGGSLDEKTGKPTYFTWQGAEKTYADFEMSVTNPGGHSSEPRAVNAIDELATALLRIQRYRFTPEVNELTRSFFVNAARWELPATARAMRAFAANPADRDAVATLSADPAMVGKIGTTCVVTMIQGGHALNALPQRATANVNCRIFPGHPRDAIMEELARAADDTDIHFRDVTAGSVSTGASPMRKDFIDAVTKAVHVSYPNVPVFPSMSSGASDSMWSRHVNVPSYGASPMFIKASDNFSHGLNERTPVANIRPALNYYLSIIPDLTH